MSCMEHVYEVARLREATGTFGFPQEEAAEIAVATVREWLDRNGSDMAVVFNVFSEKDERIYRALLGTQQRN